MLGCFGQRKKKAKAGAKQPIDRAQSDAGDEPPYPKPQAQSAPHSQAPPPAAAASKQQPQQPQLRQQEQQPVVANSPSSSTSADPSPVVETITVARAQSLHQEAPAASGRQQHLQTGGSTGGGVRKAATLGRYDFLKRYDRDGINDRWSTLKRQYLSPKSANGEDENDTMDSPMSPTSEEQQQQQQQQPPPKPRPPPLRVQALPPPKLPLSPGFLANARSLPRQFSPPSTVVSPVKFSNWFHERKSREEETRKECQDREERMQVLCCE